MSEPKETQAIIETDFITVTGEDLTKQTEIKAFVFESTENIKTDVWFSAYNKIKQQGVQNDGQ